MSRIVLALALLLALPATGAFAQEAVEANGEQEPKDVVDEDAEAPDSVKLQQEVYWAPPGAGNDGFTWIRLKSGEWQRGEIKDLHDGRLRFDSDELDEFTYDWEDVRAVISGRPHTVTTWEPPEVLTGFIVAHRDSIRILGEEGELLGVVSSDNVNSMIEGRPRERNFWSGSLSIGTTVRAGNSDQADGSTSIDLDRHALFTRWENAASFAYGSSGGAKTQETHRYTSTLDWFLSRRWFVTIAEYEYFRDPFQNIAQRHIPGAGGGYTHDFGSAEWDTTALLAWQGVRYVSVKEGESLTETSVTWRLGTSLDWEVTSDIDFDIDYSINFPVSRIEAYSSNLVSTLSVDLFRDLDLDVTVGWDRQNRPREAEDGLVPKKDDLRLTTGISWEF